MFLLLPGCKKDDDPITEEKKDPVFIIQPDEDTGKDYVMDPFSHAPMTAGIEFLTKGEDRISITATVIVKGQKNSSDLERQYSFEGNTVNTQWIPIVGMYANSENIVQVTVKEQDNIIHDETYNIPLPEIEESVIGRASEAEITGTFAGDEMIFLLYNISPMNVAFRGIIYDKQGNIRWYSNIPNSYLQFVIDGRLHVGFKGEKINGLEVYDFLGQEKENWKLEGWEDIHHDIIANPSGNLIITVSKADGSPVEQHLVELNPNSRQENKIVNSIDLSDIFPNVDNLFVDLPRAQLGGTREDVVHNNSVSFYQKDGQIVYICGSQRSGIAAIDGSGFPVWYFFPKNVQYSTFDDPKSEKRLPASGNFPPLDYTVPPSYSNLLLDPVDENGNMISDMEVVNQGKVKDNVDFVYPYRHTGLK